MKEIIITNNNKDQRLDKFLFRLLNNATNSFVYKMLRKKNITLNDKKADGREIVKAGDSIKIWFSDETYESFTKIDLKKNNTLTTAYKLNVVYEDDDVLIINKPAGLLSQNAKKDDVSVNDLIMNYLLSSGKLTQSDLTIYKPSVINRLDRNTSGLIIAAKNLRAAQILSEGFRDRTINKYYKCLVHGVINEGQNIKGYLVKDNKSNKVSVSQKNDGNSDYIETEYEPLEIMDDKSLLEVHLITGKTHQIRAHLSSIGFPLCGDHKYGIKDQYKYQCLHCYKVVFPKYTDTLTGISEKTFYGDMEKPWT